MPISQLIRYWNKLLMLSADIDLAPSSGDGVTFWTTMQLLAVADQQQIIVKHHSPGQLSRIRRSSWIIATVRASATYALQWRWRDNTRLFWTSVLSVFQNIITTGCYYCVQLSVICTEKQNHGASNVAVRPDFLWRQNSADWQTSAYSKTKCSKIMDQKS